ASDLVKLSRDILQVGGRPHKGCEPATPPQGRGGSKTLENLQTVAPALKIGVLSRALNRYSRF
ncbi:hypothetical protein, partial [Rhizobium sophorae]|uniref:hypothetical protein n=1 Tax=Rhizobium sophorae TaxID=1535242 RepID=UPI001AEEBA0E